MVNTLMSACFKTKVELEVPALRHVHVAVVDCWDIINTIEVEAAPTGGTWDIVSSVPYNKVDVPRWWEIKWSDPDMFADLLPQGVERIIKPVDPLDLASVTDIFQQVKNEVRHFNQLVEMIFLDSCPTWKIEKALDHMVINQHVSLSDTVTRRIPG